MNAKRSHPCHLTSGMHRAIQLNRDICVWPPYGHPQNPRIYRENKDRDATKLQFFLWHKCIYAGIGGHQDLRDGKHKRKDPRMNLRIVSTLTAPFSIWWLRTQYPDNKAAIDIYDKIGNGFQSVGYTFVSVRPAMWVDL